MYGGLKSPLSISQDSAFLSVDNSAGQRLEIPNAADGAKARFVLISTTAVTPVWFKPGGSAVVVTAPAGANPGTRLPHGAVFPFGPLNVTGQTHIAFIGEGAGPSLITITPLENSG